VAVAVNPHDQRYLNLIGKEVFIPLLNKKIPLISDDYVDIEFGTGVLKITPAHDQNDFEIGLRHNLERIKCLNVDGTMNEKAGIYQGLDRFVCRDQVIKDLKKEDLFIKEESIVHTVGFSERTDTIIEPYLSKQWFVKMAPLAKRALLNQTNKKTKVTFIPNRFENIFLNWMENIQDWCISRQLWWGHSLPVWYKDDEVYVGKTAS
jgi:valyl-tRNA synthetase